MEIVSISNRKWLNAFLTCMFGGFIGLHRFYTGKKAQGVWTFIGFLLFLVFVIIASYLANESAKLGVGIVALILGVGLLIWWLVDLIRISCRSYKDITGAVVSDVNKEVLMLKEEVKASQGPKFGRFGK